MKIYTDGATSNNGYKGAKGGWAWVIVDDNNQIVLQGMGSDKEVTNNQCELRALIEACDAASKMYPMYQHFDVYSDSAYCMNCYSQGWWKNWVKNGWLNSKKQPVANKELWTYLIPYFQSDIFNFYKVKGHDDDYWNNYVDRRAVEAKEFNG